MHGFLRPRARAAGPSKAGRVTEPFGAMIGDRVELLAGIDAGLQGVVVAYTSRSRIVWNRLDDSGRRRQAERSNLRLVP